MNSNIQFECGRCGGEVESCEDPFCEECYMIKAMEEDEMNRNEIHKKVIEHYGVVEQLKKTMEEIQELLDEVLAEKVDQEKVFLELSDVKNMSEQLPIIIEGIRQDFGFYATVMDKMQDKKMQRTLGRIQNGEEHG